MQLEIYYAFNVSAVPTQKCEPWFNFLTIHIWDLLRTRCLIESFSPDIPFHPPMWHKIANTRPYSMSNSKKSADESRQWFPVISPVLGNIKDTGVMATFFFVVGNISSSVPSLHPKKWGDTSNLKSLLPGCMNGGVSITLYVVHTFWWHVISPCNVAATCDSHWQQLMVPF